MKKTSVKDLPAIVQELTNCATVCEESVLELRGSSLKELTKAIESNEGCAATCRRSIWLFENDYKTASQFMRITAKELCADCEIENKKFNHDACKNSALACRHLLDFLKNYN